jgi:hypothetical protein
MGRISALLGAASFGTSLAVVASALAFVILFPDRQPAAAAKQAIPIPRPSALRAPSPEASSRDVSPEHEAPVNVSHEDPGEPIEAAPPPEGFSEDTFVVTPVRPGGENLASHLIPSEGPSPDPEMDEVNQYLWSVYRRTATKHDLSGDFTWKDIAAAAHLGMTLGDYVIVGMDRDFRELLYHAGLAMDAAGARWTILSAFRDDYRQALATGYKSRIGDSLHGGSFTTGGYGHGCAVDISDADGKSVPLWHWIDANTSQVGLERPLPGIDPAHIQARGPWHVFAASLRRDRLASAMPSEDIPADRELVDLSTVQLSEADLKCVGLHHRRTEPQLASASSEPVTFDAMQVHAVAKLPAKVEVKLPAKAEVKLPAKVEVKLPAKIEKAHARAGARVAARSSATNAEEKLRGKASAKSMAHHALHPLPRATGTT